MTDQEKKILQKASAILARIRMEKISPERRKEISAIARAKSLEVRRANAKKKKEEQGNG